VLHANYICRAVFVVFAAIANLPPAAAKVVYIGRFDIPGTAADLSGLSGMLEDGTPANRLGALGSALAYNGKSKSYYFTPDRGSNHTTYSPAIDNTTSYHARFEEFKINVTLGGGEGGSKGLLTADLIRTGLLTNERGEAFNGLSTGFTSAATSSNARLDPEGVRVGRDGKIYISDEYGPVVYEFDAATGRRLRAFDMPKAFLIEHLAGTGQDEITSNTFGRQANRGMEGLAINPQGTKLFGIMQSPLLQDHAMDAAGKRIGTNVRIVEFSLATGKATHQFVYQLGNGGDQDGKDLGASEILAINDHEFLVLERDGKSGTAAKTKKIIKIDTARATDIKDIAELPQSGLPPKVRSVTKAPIVDLMSPEFGLVGEEMPEKFEGLAFGPDLPDGRHLLIVSVDNDFIPTAPSSIFAFAIDASDLPVFKPQVFAK